ncbi:hypothetical protein [Xanthomonas campestris]|uniref:hypothetical protein n=1 Tax=Xanthomonas campestris TaxID=339 RepID=UPI0021F78F35|nr:hypothetical protein [Xanthomonas campestris]MEA9736606.1 hypothetical protein [Xanthomonas campestris pv. raphani]UYP77892.1 hypothetical protein OF401_21030 [Xanthomonas campestris pv. campestris]
MGKRYQVPEGLYINVSFPTRFAKALKKNAKKAVTLRGDACAMCLSCPGLVVVLSCCRVASVLTLLTEHAFLAVAVAVSAAPLGLADRRGAVVECSALSPLAALEVHDSTPAHCVGIESRPAPPNCVVSTPLGPRAGPLQTNEKRLQSRSGSANCLSRLKPLLHRALLQHAVR